MLPACIVEDTSCPFFRNPGSIKSGRLPAAAPLKPWRIFLVATNQKEFLFLRTKLPMTPTSADQHLQEGLEGTVEIYSGPTMPYPH